MNDFRHTSNQNLIDYLQKLDELTTLLFEAMQKRDQLENAHKIAKTEVENLKNRKDFIKEKIMGEKVLIREIK